MKQTWHRTPFGLFTNHYLSFKHLTLLLFLALVCLAGTPCSFAQGTAFTYQGRLNDGSSPANGSYDLSFTLYDATAGGALVAGPQTAAPTAVSNGGFTVSLDFGATAFDGSARWLEIGVRTNGSSANYVLLSPRQALTATPYALRAANFSGAVTSAQLPTNAAQLDASNQVFTGNVQFNNVSNLFTGAFSGDGTGLTNLPLSALRPLPLTNNQSGLTLGGTFIGNVQGATNLVVVCDGDSQTSPQWDASDWPTLVKTMPFMANRLATFTNLAVSGTGLAAANARYDATAHALRPTTGQEAYYILYIGVNDDKAGYSVSSWASAYAALCAKAHADGFKVVAMTFPRDAEPNWHSGYPGTAVDDFGVQMNAWLRQATGVWDWLIDLERLFPNPYDWQFFNADHLHFNTVGRRAIAQMVNGCLTQHASVGLGGTRFWEAEMPLVYAPFRTTNLVPALDPTQDYTPPQMSLAESLEFQTSQGGNCAALAWLVPYGFTNVSATVTLSGESTNLPVTIDLCCDTPTVRNTTYAGSYSLTNGQYFTANIVGHFSQSYGLRQVKLYFLGQNFTGLPTGNFLIHEVRLNGW